MTRKVADCRNYPSEMNCTLTISGEEDEVVRAAAEHAISVHGHDDTPELRDDIRRLLEDEAPAAAAAGTGAGAPAGDGMHFVQLIEFRTTKRDEVNQLIDEWENATGGKRTASRAVLTADHEQPNSYYEFVEFPSYDEAMRNSALPETEALSRRMRELCDGEPTFHNLDVVRAEKL
ncbi:uncharacterized protein DUF1059 [Saccharopolyspora erythraea NRRL 2338]|uniref:Uncharacterized protein n=2 Tax=Saccharopolyspora erythraea TaxID=1836 RepID=A4F6I3_SACEN|nr:DUF1059 domain-containing protein [Saccharopolyspora erythraea]PFG93460.1 uncharacterized protein DUF1059 [Saccharopolyspora erythraea NRRL 2338]QRK90329.1 DUF1059 domain-containing protein [Saccharopolyspora erythraea]CAL99657.1 hypothetical protein SACE_0308 [Saccharopolyspora erythraea NRRL 2338]